MSVPFSPIFRQGHLVWEFFEDIEDEDPATLTLDPEHPMTASNLTELTAFQKHILLAHLDAVSHIIRNTLLTHPELPNGS